MTSIKEYISSLFLNRRLLFVVGGLVALFVTAYFAEWLMAPAQVGLLALAVLLLIDGWVLYAGGNRLEGRRETPERFSNGDENPVRLHLENLYPFSVSLEVIDEAPVQFQLRALSFRVSLASKANTSLRYSLRPTERGEYHFGVLNVFVASPLGLLRRRYRFPEETMVPAYPSFLQMRHYQFMAVSHRLTETGVKKIRRLGHSTEFEQIKEYVRGDDFRTLNWKASARHNKLMVNQYADEKSQHLYCLIDKSRSMKMPFEGLSLLDYAINASLVLANIAIYKQDRAGLITFAERISSSLPADNRPRQMSRFQDVLYNQQTRFLEADYGVLYSFIRNKIPQRSLLLLFTNFESVTAMQRQLPYLQRIAHNHLLVVVFFENTELKGLLASSPATTEEIYIKTIGEHFSLEKKQIVKELERHGILALLTPPSSVTVNTLNKYLEVKARGMV